eukprot:3184795-Prymnesium_polylepis.1
MNSGRTKSRRPSGAPLEVPLTRVFVELGYIGAKDVGYRTASPPARPRAAESERPVREPTACRGGVV